MLCSVSKCRINSVCVHVRCYRRCSLSLSIYRVSSYSVSTVCATPPCARSGNKRFPGYQPSWLPAPTSHTRTDLEHIDKLALMGARRHGQAGAPVRDNKASFFRKKNPLDRRLGGHGPPWPPLATTLEQRQQSFFVHISLFWSAVLSEETFTTVWRCWAASVIPAPHIGLQDYISRGWQVIPSLEML